MAKQRVQVAQLNAPTQANLQGGTAPVVETMRVLAPDQTPETPLSSFISAIAPAFEADATERKTKRLRKEQEIANGLRKKKENQLEQARESLIAEMAIDYVKNEKDYLELEESEVLAKRQKYHSNYTNSLRETGRFDADLIDALEGDLALADVAFVKGKFVPAKIDRNYQEIDNGLTDSILAINAQVAAKAITLESGVEQVAALRQSFLEAHPDRYRDDAAINDVLVKLADTDTNDPTRVNSPLVAYLSGPESKNQLNITRNREVGAKIAKRQAAVTKSTKTALTQAAEDSFTSAVADQVIAGDFQNVNTATETKATVNVDGTPVTFTKKFSKADFIGQLETKVAAELEQLSKMPDTTDLEKRIKANTIAEAQRRHYAGYAALGGKPPEVTAALRDAKAYWTGDMNLTEKIGDETIRPNLLMAEKAYNQLEKVEQYLGSDGVSSMFDGDKKSLSMYRTIKSALQANQTFAQAIDIAQRFDINNAPKLSITVDQIRDQVDYGGPIGLFMTSDMAKAANLGALVADAENLARIKMSTNPLITEQDAMKTSIEEVAADYKPMTMPEGTVLAIKAESGSHQERNTVAAEEALRTAMNNPDFVEAVSGLYNLPAYRLVPTSVLGVESVKRVGGFTLLVQNDTTNANQLQVYVAGLDNSGKIDAAKDMYPIGKIDLTTIAEQQKFKFIEDTLGKHQQTVAPIVESTPEDDIELSYTPTVTKSFAEMTPAELLETDVAQSLGKAFSTENFYLQKALELNEAAVKGIVDVGKKVLETVNPVTEANATATIMKDEGFSYTQYEDMGKKSVGHGLQVESLEPDERALIKDINNVQPDESKAVVALKVSKINNFFTSEVDGFENLPDSTKSGVIQMGYQLGRFNVTKKWPKFMESIKEAAQYAEGSVEQATALAKAKFNMLYNVAEDGTVSATKWATQTKDRAMKVAEEVGASIGDAATSVFEAVIPKAHADTDVIPSKEQLKVGDIPTASAVADIAMAKNPADAAYKYYGIDENTEEGAKAVKGFFETAVGDWNPNNQTVEEFATNQAWCAAFLTQVLRDSGIDTKALFGKDKFDQIRAKAYTNVGTKVENTQAKAGDIMIKQHTKEERKKYKLGFGHVGIVVKVEGDEVFFIGGNTGDKVTMSSYNMKDRAVGIRRLQGASDIPTESLPSMLQLKAGVYTDKLVKKTKNLFTSMYENIFE